MSSKLSREQIQRLKHSVRTAIKLCNKEYSFSCYDCRHCVWDGGRYVCDDEVVTIPSSQKLPATMVPACFTLDHVDSPFGKIIAGMIESDMHNPEATYGWYTYIVRVLNRCNYAGHLMNVKKSNLENAR